MYRMATPADKLDLDCMWVERSTGEMHWITGVEDQTNDQVIRVFVNLESMSGVRKTMCLLTLVQHYDADLGSGVGRFVRVTA